MTTDKRSPRGKAANKRSAAAKPGAAHDPVLRSEVAPRRIALSQWLDLRGARALKEQLGSLLDEPAHLLIDAGAVTKVSTAGLQIIAAFIAARTSAGRATSIVAPSPTLHDAVRDLGLADLAGRMTPAEAAEGLAPSNTPRPVQGLPSSAAHRNGDNVSCAS